VTEHVQFKVELEEDKKRKRIKRDNVLMVKVNTTKAMEETTWTADQCKAMIQCYKQPDDPRMAKGVVDLRAQWNQRRGRASPKHSPETAGVDAAMPPLLNQDQEDDVLLGLDDPDCEIEDPDGRIGGI